METRPRLEANYFGHGINGHRYGRLARVLEYSARKYSPDWEVHVERIEPPDYESAMRNASHVWNTQKLERWRDVVELAGDGERILLIDADMMVLRSLDPIWGLSFDVAYTYRERGRLPLNGGVVFVRVSDRTRRFMRTWWEVNRRFLENAQEHQQWRAKYAGINQASFGYILEEVDHGCELARVPCLEWNCENTGWDYFNEKTRIVHIKSYLRRALFGQAQTKVTHRRIIQAWQSLEEEAKASEGGKDDGRTE